MTRRAPILACGWSEHTSRGGSSAAPNVVADRIGIYSPPVQHIEIPLPSNLDDAVVERAIDRAIASAGLQVALRGSLKKHLGCIHWHLKNGRESGTLEVTF